MEMTTREIDACLRKIRIRTHNERSFAASLQGIEIKPIEAPAAPMRMSPEQERMLENVMVQALRDKAEAARGSK